MKSLPHLYSLCSYKTALAVVTVLCAQLLLQANAHAFPTVDEIQPYGENVVANGYGRKDNESVVFYTETYLDDPMNEMIRATYWDSNRQPISYKQLTFGADPNVPDLFEVIDYRREKGYRITVKNDIANVKVIDVAADGTETIKSDKDVTIDSSTVIDAAFHRFIVSEWDKLLSGEAIKINFLQIDKARLVPLKINQTKCDTPKSTCFRITIDNFLLQNVVPNIFMKYETSTKRLIQYTGIGPITKMNGKALPVDIRYEYLQ